MIQKGSYEGKSLWGKGRVDENAIAQQVPLNSDIVVSLENIRTQIREYSEKIEIQDSPGGLESHYDPGEGGGWIETYNEGTHHSETVTRMAYLTWGDVTFRFRRDREPRLIFSLAQYNTMNPSVGSEELNESFVIALGTSRLPASQRSPLASSIRTLALLSDWTHDAIFAFVCVNCGYRPLQPPKIRRIGGTGFAFSCPTCGSQVQRSGAYSGLVHYPAKADLTPSSYLEAIAKRLSKDGFVVAKEIDIGRTRVRFSANGFSEFPSRTRYAVGVLAAHFNQSDNKGMNDFSSDALKYFRSKMGWGFLVNLVVAENFDPMMKRDVEDDKGRHLKGTFEFRVLVATHEEKIYFNPRAYQGELGKFVRTYLSFESLGF